MKLLKFFAIAFFSLISSLSLFSQGKLSFVNSSWTTIIPGEVVSQPSVTSYGFCVPTDGKMISAFSDEGKLLWEKPTESSKNISITTLPNDFLLIRDHDRDAIKLLNSSGTEIWTRELPYKVTKAPFPGRDGRFFITGDNIVECYGINGVCKWSLETKKQRNVPIQELPDGSIVVFLEEINGKTQALRISPFGKAIEEIIFSGRVLNSYTTPEGIFLTFENGNAGLFSLTDGLAKNRWGFTRKNEDAVFASYGDTDLYIDLFSNKVTVNRLSLKDGTVTGLFEINGLNGLELKIINLSDTGLLLADSNKCYLCNTEGNVLWSAIMPENNGITKWDYVTYTGNNYLVFFMENWTINGYLTNQSLRTAKAAIKLNYNKYYEIDSNIDKQNSYSQIDRTIIKVSRYNELKEGYYGEKEQKYTSDIFSVCSSYLNSLARVNHNNPKPSVFETDPYGVESVFKQLSLYGTSDSADYLAKLILKTKNKSYLRILLESSGVCGYDPDGKILKAIGTILPEIDSGDEKSLKAACDAVYSICVFMGRPAFTKQGKDIIKELLYPKYSNNTQNYASNTFKKILDLDL